MSDYLKRVPWMQLLWPTLLAVIFYAYTANVKATIHEELKGYLTKEEFTEYRRYHDEKVILQVESLHVEILAVQKSSKENNALLKQLLMQRPLRGNGGQP